MADNDQSRIDEFFSKRSNDDSRSQAGKYLFAEEEEETTTTKRILQWKSEEPVL